jgi:hypothetical protein
MKTFLITFVATCLANVVSHYIISGFIENRIIMFRCASRLKGFLGASLQIPFRPLR